MARVTAQLRSGTQATISARQFQWLADEPVAVGGTDEGPDPYELLLGALAACITITLRLYADHKGIPLDGVDVTLEFDRVHADDCLECDDPEGGMLDRIQTEVTIFGSFDEAQRTRLARVAERCPVHKTLARRVHIFDSVSVESTAGSA
jgi:putative redox protein